MLEQREMFMKQKLSETEKELVLKYLENKDYKVTEAKAKKYQQTLKN